MRLIGSPSAIVTLAGEEWIYVGSQTVTKPFRLPEEERRQVVRLPFSGDKVTKVETGDLADGRHVGISSATTPVEGNSVSFVDQIIGNIGRFEQRK